MNVKMVGGNIIGVESPKKPTQPLFGTVVPKQDDVVNANGTTRLIPRTATEK